MEAWWGLGKALATGAYTVSSPAKRTLIARRRARQEMAAGRACPAHRLVDRSHRARSLQFVSHGREVGRGGRGQGLLDRNVHPLQPLGADDLT